MSVIFEAPDNGKAHLFTKGAIERIIELCVEVGVGHEVKPMTDRLKADVLRQMDIIADQGLVSASSQTLECMLTENAAHPRRCPQMSR